FAPLLWESAGKEQVVEQIWLPGVHADVGGNSGGRSFLSDVSLLTMIDRIKYYCPRLRFDKNRVQDLRNRLKSHDEIVISDERPDILRKFLWRGKRTIGEHKTTEFMHPIFQTLKGKRLIIRGRKRDYLPLNCTQNLPVIKMGYDSEFE